MKKPTPITDILEAMWIATEEHGATSKRKLKSEWRKLLKQHRLDQTRIVLHVGRDHFLVSSDSRPGEFHTVDMHDLSCSCERYTLGGKTCHHLKDMGELEQKGLLPKQYVH